jgi:hypothetical protein
LSYIGNYISDLGNPFSYVGNCVSDLGNSFSQQGNLLSRLENSVFAKEKQQNGTTFKSSSAQLLLGI